MLIGTTSLLLLPSPSARYPASQAFFAQFMSPPPPSPADFYQPDPLSRSPGLPGSYEDIHAAAIRGVRAALESDVRACEVDYPAVPGVNARGDGSAQSERRVAEANAEFARKLRRALVNAVVVACSGDAARALGGDAFALRDGAVAAQYDVAICVSPCTDEQWEAALGLGAKSVVIVNGLLQNGLLPHAYYYKPLTAFSAQTGAVVRCFPGAYECYDSQGERMELEVPLARQGRRALPDTKDAQMLLQNRFGQSR